MSEECKCGHDKNCHLTSYKPLIEKCRVMDCECNKFEAVETKKLLNQSKTESIKCLKCGHGEDAHGGFGCVHPDCECQMLEGKDKGYIAFDEDQYFEHKKKLRKEFQKIQDEKVKKLKEELLTIIYDGNNLNWADVEDKIDKVFVLQDEQGEKDGI